MEAQGTIRVCEGVAVLTSTNSSNHTCATESGLRRESENSEKRFGHCQGKKEKQWEKREREIPMPNLSKFVAKDMKKKL
jgi:hypothetical protein